MGSDIRPQNIRRTELMPEHVQISADRLVLRRQSIYDLPLTADEQFDVVPLLGLVYHLEDLAGTLRRARMLTRRVLVVESQLTRAALEQMATVAGFRRTRFLQPADDHSPQFVHGDRAVMLAWP